MRKHENLPVTVTSRSAPLAPATDGFSNGCPPFHTGEADIDQSVTPPAGMISEPIKTEFSV